MPVTEFEDVVMSWVLVDEDEISEDEDMEAAWSGAAEVASVSIVDPEACADFTDWTGSVD